VNARIDAAPRRVTQAPLAHQRWGSGDTAVLLLHGIGGSSDAWGDALAGTGSALAAAGYAALAVDFPGYGETPLVEPYTLAALARAVAELRAAVGARRSVLVGHSMGGMVAQELVALSPLGVDALVLCNTSPAFGRPGGDWQREFLRERFAPLDAGAGMAALAASLVPTLLAPGARHAALAGAQALLAAVPEATYRRALAALVAFDRRDALGRIGVPTLVLTGEHDGVAPPGIAQRMAARIAGAECVVLPGAGHLANLETPDEFNRTLLEFLQRRVAGA
jgi:3-oxoadipate enol-lactonase